MKAWELFDRITGMSEQPEFFRKHMRKYNLTIMIFGIISVVLMVWSAWLYSR